MSGHVLHMRRPAQPRVRMEITANDAEFRRQIREAIELVDAADAARLASRERLARRQVERSGRSALGGLIAALCVMGFLGLVALVVAAWLVAPPAGAGGEPDAVHVDGLPPVLLVPVVGCVLLIAVGCVAAAIATALTRKREGRR